LLRDERYQPTPSGVENRLAGEEEGVAVVIERFAY
jgi:hypothetical protein